MIKKKRKFTYYKNKAAEKGIELVDSKQKRKYADELTRTIQPDELEEPAMASVSGAKEEVKEM